MWTFDATPIGRVLLEQVTNAYPLSLDAPDAVRAVWYALDQASLIIPEYSGVDVPGISDNAYYTSILAKFQTPYQSGDASSLLRRALEIAGEAATMITQEFGELEDEVTVAVVGRALRSYLLVFRVRDLIEDALAGIFGTRGAPEVSDHIDYLIDNGGKEVQTEDIASYLRAQFPPVSRDDDRVKKATDLIVGTLVPLLS